MSTAAPQGRHWSPRRDQGLSSGCAGTATRAVHVVQVRPSTSREMVNAAHRHAQDVPVSVTSVYNKLNGPETGISQALVAETAHSLEEVIAALPAAPADRPVHACADGLGVGQPARLHLLGLARVDVLDVRVRDPVRHLAGQLGRVGAADQEVPGVQAQRDRRALQHAAHVHLAGAGRGQSAGR